MPSSCAAREVLVGVARQKRPLLSFCIQCSFLFAVCWSGLAFSFPGRLFGNYFDIAIGFGCFAFSLFLATRTSASSALQSALVAACRPRYCLVLLAGLVGAAKLLGFLDAVAAPWLFGVFAGWCLCSFVAALSSEFRGSTPSDVMAFIGCGLLGSVGVLAVVSLLIPLDLQCLAWLVLLCACPFEFRSAGCCLPRGVDEGACSAQKNDRRIATFFFGLSFFSVGFVLGNFPGNFHLTDMQGMKPPSSSLMNANIGFCDVSVLFAFALLALLFVVIGVCIASNPPKIMPMATAMLLLIMASCITVPAYNSSPVAILVPVSFLSAFFSAGCYMRVRGGIKQEDGHCSAASCLAFGALCFELGSIAALFHILLDATQSSPQQILVFVVMIALVAIEALTAIRLRALVSLVFLPKPTVFDVQAGESRTDFAAACENLAVHYGLTKRETEIFALLAEGRDGPYIQEKLFIAKNTFKSHSLHIYRKLGIKSKQELIDMVYNSLE